MKYVLDEGAFAPEYAHETDAGMDLRSPREVIIPCKTIKISGDRIYEVGGSAVINTGVHVEIPHGCVGFFKSKSGLNVSHEVVSEGVIDEGYTGPLIVKLYNHGEHDYKIHKGDKITQLVILGYNHVTLEEVDKLESTERGNRGFGSTGR